MDALAPTHLILIGTAALVLFFGWKQLPDMSRSLGRSMHLFKAELNAPATAATETTPASTVASLVKEGTSDAA